MGPADCRGGGGDGRSCPSAHPCCWLIFHEHGSAYCDYARAVHVYARVHPAPAPAPAPAPVIIGDDDGGDDGGGAVVGEIDSAVVVVDGTAGAAGARDTALSSSLDLQIQ